MGIMWGALYVELRVTSTKLPEHPTHRSVGSSAATTTGDSDVDALVRASADAVQSAIAAFFWGLWAVLLSGLASVVMVYGALFLALGWIALVLNLILY